MSKRNTGRKGFSPPTNRESPPNAKLCCPKCGREVVSLCCGHCGSRLSAEQSNLYGAVAKKIPTLRGNRADATNKRGILNDDDRTDPREQGNAEPSVDAQGNGDKGNGADAEHQLSIVYRRFKGVVELLGSIDWDSELLYGTEVEEILQFCGQIVNVLNEQRQKMGPPKKEDTKPYLNYLRTL
jgi:hypothetical protein